jgi:MlaD protein/NACHT domain
MNRHSPDARNPGDRRGAPWRVVVRSFYVAIILVVAAVLWLGHTEFSQEAKRYYIFLRGSVAGLSKGTEVQSDGIPVGRVVDIRIDPSNIEQTQVTVEVDTSLVDIKSDARAVLVNENRSVSAIQLSRGTREAPVLEPQPGHKYPVIASDPSSLQNVHATADPWLAQLWRENKTAVIGGFGSAVLLLSYVGVFGLMLLFAPARLARVGGAPGLDDAARPSGIFGIPFDLARKAFVHVTLPYLCRHPRVRRAWSERYSTGRAKLSELGKPARESFVLEPEVLDAWVQPRIQRAIAALNQLELFKQRRIYVELPVRVGERQGGAMIEHPSAEAFRGYFAEKRAVVAIVGDGGSGKSTLACALARWAIADDPKERLAEHRMLPVFIVEDTTDLVRSVTRNLRRMLADEELPDDLVRGLLAKQRLLVIVDALSERESDTQQHVVQVFGEEVSLSAIVITSRAEPVLGAVDRTTLYPVRLDAARVVPFIIGYLDRLEHAESLKDGRVQLRLGERILALAEAGGQGRPTPVTPLLVTLFVQSAIDRAAEGRSLDEMPDAVPEVFIDYLRRLNSGGAQATTAVPDNIFIEAAQILASVSLGPNLLPQDFLEQDASDRLAKGGMAERAQILVDRLVSSGLIERRLRAGRRILRFSLDPAAEYLAAIHKIFELKAAGPDVWHCYLAELAQREGYPDGFAGYLMALATCHRAYRQDFRLPEVRFPWEDGKEM